ncbi:conserved hypothetical protein [Beggiatoa sp. PS]|nr:conserved hypothetical protein [Beggiatoa sp. PS]
MSIRPDYLTFDDLLQKKLFRIPNYQRAYSWESKQRKDLFFDIEKLNKSSDKEKHHFMATLVCLKIGKETVVVDEFWIFHIVDGQQRLTTLIILLKALQKVLNTGNNQEQKVANDIQHILIKEDNRLILLQTNHDNSHFFRNYLETGSIPESEKVKTTATQHLIEAFKECENFVNQWTNQYGGLSLLQLIKNRLGFIFYLLEDEGSAYTVFEVLNSRGLEVDWLDKCKTLLMGIAFETANNKTTRDEHLNELHKLWSEIYRTIGITKIQGHEILRFAATLEDQYEPNRIMSAEKAIEFFRDECQANPRNIVKVTHCFLEIAETLKSLYENPRREAITRILHTRLLAVSIMMKNSLKKEERDHILKQWENVTFRIYGLFRKDSRTKVGEYTRLAWQMAHNTLTANTLIKKIANIGEEYSIEEAVEELREMDCYNGWEMELRYFLYRYEENLAKEQGSAIGEAMWQQIWSVSATKTIEHILPQSSRTQKEHIHRLGNLTLLPPQANSKAGKKTFQQKREIYQQNKQLKLMDEIINKRRWTTKEIEERENRLLDWAIDEWGWNPFEAKVSEKL